MNLPEVVSSKVQVLFIQGGGEGAHEEDAKLVESLRGALGPDYEIRYPRMPDEADPDYRAWADSIASELANLRGDAILVGHSIGASVLIKWLTQATPKQPLPAAFLIAAPFWHDDDVWRWKQAELPQDAGARLPRALRLFLYHGCDDEVVPVAHVDRYARALPQARVRRLNRRNHQLGEDLAEVARDIRSLTRRSDGHDEVVLRA